MPSQWLDRATLTDEFSQGSRFVISVEWQCKNTDCPIILCIILHPTDSYSCISTPFWATTPLKVFLNEGSDKKGEHWQVLNWSSSGQTLFILASFKSLWCADVVYGKFVNSCIAVLYSNVMGSRGLWSSDIPLPSIRPPLVFSDLINSCSAQACPKLAAAADNVKTL